MNHQDLFGTSNYQAPDDLGLRSLQQESSTTSPPSLIGDTQSNTNTNATIPNSNITNGTLFDFDETAWDSNQTSFPMNYSYVPSDMPSDSPSDAPSFAPSISLMPSSIPSNSPSSAPTTYQQKFINSNDSQIIAETFRIYGSLYLVFFLSFCYLRRKFPVLFNIRSWVPEMKTDLATNKEYGFFSWCWQVFSISDDDLLDTCGMDALCFLRALRLGAKRSINALWLVPVYLTAEEAPETEELSDIFVLMSVANVPNNSYRFISTIIAAYITMLAAMYMISKEYDWFTKYRHRYLAQQEPRNYAVYVSGIPEKIRSSYALADHFRQCTSWSEAVFEAHVAMDIPSLEAKVAKRDNLVEKIEHIMALERKSGSKRSHHTMNINVKSVLKGEGVEVQKVESVTTYMKQLDKLNGQITLEAGQVRGSNHRMRQHLTRVNTTTRNISRFDLMSPPTEDFTMGGGGGSGSGSSDRRQFMGFPSSSSAPSLPTLEEGQGSFSRIEYYGDIEEGSSSSISANASEGNLDINELRPSSSDEKKTSVSMTEPSTDFDTIAQQPNVTTDSSSTRETPHPFLAMFGLDASMFDRSTLDLMDTRDAEDTLNSLSVDTPDKVYEDKIDESYRYESGFDLDKDSPEGGNNHTPSYNQMMEPEEDEAEEKEYLGGVPHREDIPDDIGHGTLDASMLDFMGLMSESPELSRDDTRSDNRGSLSRGSSGSRSSTWNESVRDSVKSRAHKVSVGTARVSNRVKKASKMGASKVMAAKKLGVSGVKKAADFGLQKIQQAPDLGAQLASSAAASAASVVPLRLNRTEGQAREAGFVVFRDLYTTQAARQMLQHHIASSMQVEAAPDPEEVFWRNVGLPLQARKSGWLLSIVATSILCFFWSIPMAFFSSLTEVNSLKENLPTLADWLDKYPGLESFLALIAPLLVLTLNESLLPLILKWFATWEGHVGASALEASLFVKLCAFVFIQTFFVSAVSGTISAELANFLENPEELVNLLANSLPAQSSYFIQICFVFTFLLQGLDLIRAYPLGVAFLRRYVFGPRLTAKERRKTWNMFHSLEDPPEFWHAELLAQLMLFFVVFFVYTTIAPITSVFLFFCFMICESGYRYHFVHNQKPTPDSGGKLWQGFINVLLASMLIGQCTLFGLLILKKTVFASAALAPLGVITVLFIIFTVPKRNHVATYLPTLKCVAVDKRNKEEGIDVSQFAAHEYLQPALRAQPMWPEGMEIARPRARTMSRGGTK